MTSSSTIQKLEGANEPFSDTIRRLLYLESGLTDVMFTSEGGTNEGRSTTTGLTAATVRLVSASDPDTYLDLTWRALGVSGNDWMVFLQQRNAAAYELQAGNSRIRIRMPTTGTMAELRAGLMANTDITDLITLGAIHGDDTATRPADGTISFAGGTEHTVDYNEELSAIEMAYLEKESAVVVRLTDGPIATTEETNSFCRKHATVMIKIFGKHAVSDTRSRIVAVRDAIDIAVFDHVLGPFPKAAEDQQSAIERFARFSIDWEPTYEDGDDDSGVIEALVGSIPVVYTIGRDA